MHRITTAIVSLGALGGFAASAGPVRADDFGVGFFGGGHDHTGFVGVEVGGRIRPPRIRMPRIHWPRVSFDVTAYPLAPVPPPPAPAWPVVEPAPTPGPFVDPPSPGDGCGCREWIPAHDV